MYIHIEHLIAYMHISIIGFLFYSYNSRHGHYDVTINTFRAERTMKKKVVPVVASVLGASLLLTACGGNKDHASGVKANDKVNDKQAINLSFASEIPTMDVAK